MKSSAQHILVLGMGGTIAGLARDPRHPGMYEAGRVSIESLLAGIQIDPALEGFEIQSQQIASIDSRDLSEDLLTQLGMAVKEALHDSAVLGVVVTHGTDTIEETGIFLDAVCSKAAQNQGKRVVLTGAMLPSNAIGADGPLNLQAALHWVGNDISNCPPGIFAIFAGRVCLARDLAKRHTTELNAPLRDSLSSPVHLINPSWLSTVRAIQAASSADLPIPPEKEWPWVEIVMSHAGARPETIERLASQGIQGLVIAGTGMGGVHSVWQAPLQSLESDGVAIVRASRTGAGNVSPDRLNGVSAGDLTPPKARIALQLALYAAAHPAESAKSLGWQDFFARIVVLLEH